MKEREGIGGGGGGGGLMTLKFFSRDYLWLCVREESKERKGKGGRNELTRGIGFVQGLLDVGCCTNSFLFMLDTVPCTYPPGFFTQVGGVGSAGGVVRWSSSSCLTLMLEARKLVFCFAESEYRHINCTNLFEVSLTLSFGHRLSAQLGLIRSYPPY